jgi:hypothetical protein
LIEEIADVDAAINFFRQNFSTAERVRIIERSSIKLQQFWEWQEKGQ